MVKRLITERDVREAPVGSTLRVAPGCVVTPAARDLASLRRVRLEDAGEGAKGAAASLLEGGSVDLPDGDWLLEVRGGKARLRRIDDPAV